MLCLWSEWLVKDRFPSRTVAPSVRPTERLELKKPKAGPVVYPGLTLRGRLDKFRRPRIFLSKEESAAPPSTLYTCLRKIGTSPLWGRKKGVPEAGLRPAEYRAISSSLFGGSFFFFNSSLRRAFLWLDFGDVVYFVSLGELIGIFKEL
jgi:hypothetical protein